MADKTIYIGTAAQKPNKQEITGGYVEREGEIYYRIANYDRMAPFFMSIVSDSDHWLFISSTGGLTAGRKNAENALFPYYTDDKIHDSAHITGSKTIIRAEKNGQTFLWEPFSDRYAGIYSIRRNIYKNIPGNKLIFEETNDDLELSFSYAWLNSEKFGFIKKSVIKNTNAITKSAEILDGIQNILPYGINLNMQTELSTLLDAYKTNELLADCPLGLFRLSSIPVDRAEPSEALKVSTVWTTGLTDPIILLSTRQIKEFLNGRGLTTETDIRAARGAFLVHSQIKLSAGSDKTWYLVAEINQDMNKVAALRKMLISDQSREQLLEEDITTGTENLCKIVSKADGLQHTGDALSSRRHFANVMFNVMRGGIFENGYMIPVEDFIAFVHAVNKTLAKQFSDLFHALPKWIHYNDLTKKCRQPGNRDLSRICGEYLPLTFSRRHGDPSRPWNKFSIETKNARGEKNYAYQGNWRDIFQNWEALALSYPGFLPAMIRKFVNASTADGYNPYRVTREGFDWEVLDPADPWSNIGYWGDHQIIYLLKFLELSRQYHPGELEKFLVQEDFVYAHLPYRIKNYQEIVSDPRDTIIYDNDLAEQLQKRATKEGADGKLVHNQAGEIYYVTLSEKLLATLLAKLANFIPGAGIWLNTQRPEWNDANNALVGSGVSMVTLYYIRRFAAFCRDMYHSVAKDDFTVSKEMHVFFDTICSIFSENLSLIKNHIDDMQRREILDQLGKAGSAYRETIYNSGFSGQKEPISQTRMITFFDLVLDFVDHSIRSNLRNDGLYHAYNLIKFDSTGPVMIRRLYEMLEGQVSVLSSGLLTVQESLTLLESLRKSALFRPDQHSYILYPDRELPHFTEKNIIPDTAFNDSLLLQRLADDSSQNIISRDVEGQWHFNGSLRNSAMLVNMLRDLPQEKYGELSDPESIQLAEIFEKIFDHQSFTGRSGTFFGYEGLGSIYWHMVSKLLLAIGEIFHREAAAGTDQAILRSLKQHYYDVRKGIGVDKSPQNYGAFPTDPYSHTPAHKGAQQPGLTGQVKEDILSRFMELGLTVISGEIHFSPTLLRAVEFSSQPETFEYYDAEGHLCAIDLPAKSLAFTYCQIPVVYHLAGKNGLVIVMQKEEKIKSEILIINSSYSIEIFKRGGRVMRIELNLVPDLLV